MALYFRTLFPNLAFRSLDDIESLKQYMYLEKIETTIDIPTIEHLPLKEEKKEAEEEPAQPPATIPSPKNIISIIYPKQQDSLFWSIYIARHGYAEYTNIGHHYGNIEIEEKQKMMELMKTSPNKIKECPKRITKAQYQEIMSDFMTNKRVTIEMLIAFSIYYDMRVWIIKVGSPAAYMDIYGNDTLESEPIIIYSKPYNQYGIDITEGEEKAELMANIKTKYFRFDNYDTPLKAISNYKTIDLECIVEQLGIKMEGKYKKQDLYNKIIQKFI